MAIAGHRERGAMALDGADGTATACLVLPTRDDAETLRRALRSYRPLVSCYAVSLDPDGPVAEQRAVIAEELDGVPGTVTVDRREGWGDALHQAVTERGQRVAAEHGATWLFVAHGDDTVETSDAWRGWPSDGDAWCTHSVDVAPDGRAVHGYPFPRLLRVGLPWRWMGRAHELPTLGGSPPEAECVAGVEYRKPWKERAGSQGVWREVLLADLADAGPSDDGGELRVPWLYARSTFYVAQTYAGEAMALDGDARAESLRKAAEWHARRAGMTYGGAEERGVSAYYAWKHAGMPDIAGALDAAEMLPGRPEPLFDLGVAMRNEGRTAVAWLFASHAWRLAQRGGWRGGMFVDEDVCGWRCAALAAALASEVGEMRAGLQAATEAAEWCPGGVRGRMLAEGEVSEVELWLGVAGRYADACEALREVAAGGSG